MLYTEEQKNEYRQMHQDYMLLLETGEDKAAEAIYNAIPQEIIYELENEGNND